MRMYMTEILLLDIISSIPFDYLLLLVENAHYLRQFIRLLRLFKIYRLREIIKIILNNTSLDEQFLRLCMMFGLYIIIIHWSTCLTIYISLLELNQDHRYDG